MGARPWAGETLKSGRKINGPPKLMVFKDQVGLLHIRSLNPNVYGHRANCWQIVLFLI